MVINSRGNFTIHCQVLQQIFLQPVPLYTWGPRFYVCVEGSGFHVPHLAEAVSFAPFLPCPYFHQNRSSQVPVIRRYPGRESSSRTTFFHSGFQFPFPFWLWGPPLHSCQLSNAFQKMLCMCYPVFLMVWWQKILHGIYSLLLFFPLGLDKNSSR